MTFSTKNAPSIRNFRAHSRATLFLHDKASEVLRRLGKPENTFYNAEIPIDFPGIRTEPETAKNEYDDPEKVELILLSGGITDITVANILNIVGKAREFRAVVPKHGNDKLFELLSYAADCFPTARIAVLGYYPSDSKHGSTLEVFNPDYAIAVQAGDAARRA